ncbi:MAG: Re/Si-specific NAD(P)(+) transhydrogenase subunit alpha [Chloroflexi bacterium]|nr:Re/Si-specific NAD(P)(+) transhydrogenase subunit alpha [Chloroflexota bacterium]
MKVAIAKETAPNERRVALVPEVIGKLVNAGLEVLVESGAGEGSAIPDSAYVDAGATIVPSTADGDVVLRVQKPSAAEIGQLRSGQAVIGLLQPLIDPQTSQSLADKGVTAISLDALPRTLSRAQTMDALSSQANVGGYKAVIIAAEAYGRYFPLLTTAAGTAKPANVLILGIGVAGLQAIATARRLGAQVKAYDVRSETREQAQSLGAQFLELKSVADAAGSGGYARELTAEERAAQQQELNGYIGGMDVVITTAQVPGRRPPVLVTADAVALMRPGSVIVDMAASALGGNVELSQPDQTIVTDNGVTIIAPTNLPATMPAGASAFYARNISALLLHMVKDGQLVLDRSDEITGAVVIAMDGKVVQEATAKALGIEPATPAPAPEPEPEPEPEPVVETATEVAEATAETAAVIEDAEASAEAIVEEAGVTATEAAEDGAAEVLDEAADAVDQADETPLHDTKDGGPA